MNIIVEFKHATGEYYTEVVNAELPDNLADVIRENRNTSLEHKFRISLIATRHIADLTIPPLGPQ